MKLARGLPIVCYGLFAMAGQTLLFREFLTAFEGNDLSVGAFFGSWFLWVGLGALSVGRAGRISESLSRHTGLLLLAYLPAFILELLLILQVRRLAGVAPYGLLPVRTLLLWSLAVNAPVSAVTGALFPLACRWVRTFDDFPVAYVYILEAVGSFLGALGVTVLLAFGASLIRIFLILAAVLSGGVFLFYVMAIWSRRSVQAEGQRRESAFLVCGLPLGVVGLSLVCLSLGMDRTETHSLQMLKWTRLLPGEALRGSFQTAQAEYLYGQYQGQWVFLREGSVCEAVPDDGAASQTAAIVLCQKPDARRILVVGSGLGLCRQFLRLPQIEAADWCHPDGQFIRRVNNLLEPPERIVDDRFHPVPGDVRSLLADKRDFYDIAIVNLPGANSSVLNRYYTAEFYRLLKSALGSGGVVMVGVTGGENVMGAELVNLGASTKATLDSVFSKLVLVPGERTWFLAGDSDSLAGDPALLRDHFASLAGGADIFPPEALLSVYLPERAAKALDLYSHADVPAGLLINRDAWPLTYLYGLLVVAKQAGAPLALLVQRLIPAGPLVFFIPIAVCALVLAASAFATPAGRGLSSFAASFLTFSTGWVGVGVSIVLMYLFQTRFGSLYLHIGLISCLFMLGLSLGAVAIRPMVRVCAAESAGDIRLSRLLYAIGVVQSLCVVATAIFFTGGGAGGFGEPGGIAFAAAFTLCGVSGGGYFPVAAQRLVRAGFETGTAAGRLEMADHFGAAVGSLTTSLLLVPVLGARMALFVLVALVLANLPLWALSSRRTCVLPARTAASGRQRAGYALFAVGLSVALCSNVVAASAARLRQTLPVSEAAALAGSLKIEPARAHLSQIGGEFTYFKVFGPQDEPVGWIFSSRDLAAEVSGFGGRMNLAIRIDAEGRLVGFHVIESHETPSYLELLRPWYDRLQGRSLFESEPFRGVDAVAGATISSKAVLTALQMSAGRFAAEVLGRQIPRISDAARTTSTGRLRGGMSAHSSSLTLLYLAGIFVLALAVSLRGGFWSRLAVLAVTLAMGGILFNTQYSMEQVVAVLSLGLPSMAAASALLLVLGVPILVLLFGNLYCGYVCPFGALQELLGYVLPRRFKPRLTADTMWWGRFVKYLVLFVLVTAFCLSRDKTTLSAEPLISAFNFRFLRGISQDSSTGTQAAAAVMIAVSLLAAVSYERFWCRYVCPVGAFLSLLNRGAVLVRFLPAKRFGKCEFGLSTRDHLDCIHCDRCRYPIPIFRGQGLETAPLPVRSQERRFLAMVMVVAAIIPILSIGRLVRTTRLATQPAQTIISAAGQSRDVDPQLFRTLIDRKRLSDQEARFYRRIE